MNEGSLTNLALQLLAVKQEENAISSRRQLLEYDMLDLLGHVPSDSKTTYTIGDIKIIVRDLPDSRFNIVVALSLI